MSLSAEHPFGMVNGELGGDRPAGRRRDERDRTVDAERVQQVDGRPARHALRYRVYDHHAVTSIVRQVLSPGR
ncbi:hypothetical protein [Actinoallomurus iriomotensis]|uniref:Uncharacterized protein n=1 Tax=Actinoallomurus iriomotensis TaxID=478107 RepID=A0A9W6W6K1_9ACTN|nr:hypothetical protein [Actinoallomurus iriomotensis]GLY92107.1 hypothetical protein Airi02_100350 [Actinoallomurus iriomotensis]